MKIIQLIQKPQLRGAEIFACQLSNHLQELGHEVLVVSIFKGDSQIPYTNSIHLNRPISKRFFDIKGWKRFSKIAKEFQPDIIQANAADTLKFATSSKFLFDYPGNLVFRNANKMGDFIDSKVKWFLNKTYLSKIDYVISVSKECEKDFINTFNFNKKISTVEIGVEEAHPGDIPKDLISIFEKGRIITHIGGFVKEKNHIGLLKIFNEVCKSQKDIQLLLIGKGPLFNEIQLEVENLGLSDRVYFLGYRNDVLSILKASSVFALPSLIEGLPGVILEAMYCEVPVVAYNVGGVGEVVNNNTGWLITPNDESAFVESAINALDKNKEVEDKVLFAKSVIMNKFLNKAIAKRFLNCYRELNSDSQLDSSK